MNIIDTETACSKLIQGHIIAHPTETVFGLGVLAHHINTVEKLKTLKQRQNQKGWVILIEKTEDAYPLVDPNFHHLIPQYQHHWPGPFTLVFPAKPGMLDHTHQNQSIALRVSPHAQINALLKRLQAPLISTSANPRGLPPALSHQALIQYQKSVPSFAEINHILDGAIGNQPPSTIINTIDGAIIRK